VHDERQLRRDAEVPQPPEQLGLVGVGRESADRSDLARDGEILAVDPDLLRALLQLRAERAFALVAGRTAGSSRRRR